MTNRLSGLTVVFEKDVREDDAETLINAIRQFRGVLDVVPEVADHVQSIADTRSRTALMEALYKISQEWKWGSK